MPKSNPADITGQSSTSTPLQLDAQHVERMASTIVSDALVLGELLDELIGNGVDYANTLAVARDKVCRMGAVADRLVLVSGGDPTYADPMRWVMHDVPRQAFESLGAAQLQGARQ